MSAPRFNPFPGLRSFETTEKHLFFGREVQTIEMLLRLGGTRFLAAVGPSGSGKSSLVRAGLVPELLGGTNTRAGSRWIVIILRPGGDPVAALAAALADSELYEGTLEDAPLQIQATLSRSARGLIESVRQARPPTGTNVLVVVDQFEEIFRFAGSRTERADAPEAFVNLLLEASRDPTSAIYVVLTMRSDFIGDCARFLGLAEAINDAQYLIPRLTRDQWRLAIEGPVRVGGGTITPRLVQRLLNDVADDPDQLPVLQHALMRTWDYWAKATAEAAGEIPPIDLPHYEAVGGMAKALSRHADEALADLPDEADRRIAERLFKALTEKGPDGRGVRHPARFEVLRSSCGVSAEQLARVAGPFRQVGRTFILPGGNGALQPATVLDISHESLMRVWTRLRDWVDEEAQSAQTYRRLAETAELWNQGKAALYRDPELALALLWRETDQPTEGWGQLHRGDFPLAIRFLTESAAVARREREQREAAQREKEEYQRRELEYARARAEEQTRRARIYSIVAVVMAALVIITIVAAIKLRRMQQEAVVREREAISRELAARAINQLDVDPEVSVFLATEGMQVNTNLVAEEVLRQALFASHVRFRLGQVGGPPVRVVEYSPDGARVITAGASTNAGLWDAHTGQSVAVLTGHSGGINTARFGSQGLAVTASNDGSARIWNATNGQLVKVISTDTNAIRTAEFSRDGSQLVTASEDGTARVWSGKAWTEVTVLPAQGGKAQGAVFSPSGNQVVVVGDSGSSRLWNLRPKPVALVLSNELNAPDLILAAFDRNGDLFATATGAKEGQIDIWKTSTGKNVGFNEASDLDELTPSGFERLPATALEFAHAHDYVLSAFGRLARVWVPTNSAVFTALRGHQETILGATFSADDSLVLTSSADRTARLWTSSGGKELLVLRGHGRQVNGASLTPDGLVIATASDDGTARLWSSGTGIASELPQTSIAAVSFSADGAQAASIGVDEPKVVIWPTSSPTNVVQIGTNVSRFALSGDGQTAVLFGQSNSIQSWTANSNRLHTLPVSDAPLSDPALNFDGSLLFWTGTNQGARLWKLKPSAEEVAVPDPEWSWAMSASDPAAFSPREALLALVSRQTNVVVYQLGSDVSPLPRLRLRIERPHEIKRLSFSSDGRHLVAVGDDSVVRGWDMSITNHLEPLWQLTHDASVTDARFSPDNRFVVTASVDGAARIWSASTGKLIAKLVGAEALAGATFTPGLGSVV
ncbi:MAG TPA: hypothetical protein DCE44_06740, partial [Verrucomicrobiales bacterium]|nr:hypothetical protein [Verrucomicrobiales bacterium]